MNRKRVRKFINDIHLWLGLSSGLILFVVCLTGTVYTFRSEIERWMEPEKYYSANPTAAPLSGDEIINKIESGQKGKIVSLVIPADKSMNWQVSVKKQTKASAPKASGKPAADARPKTFFVDPASGEIVAAQGGSTSEFFTKVMQLHRWLLMEDYGGRIIVGVATIIFVFMILTGLVLWFPAKWRLIRQVLTIRTSASWKRINHDLHNTLGFYSFIVLLIMALTGLCWSFEWYRNGLSDVLGAKVFKGRNEKPLISKDTASLAAKTSIQQVIVKADSIFNYAGTLRLSIPEDRESAFTATKTAAGFFTVAGADKAQFDRFSGEALDIVAFAEKPLNARLADSIKIIHTGEIFGTFSKIIYFIVCLIATSLPVTGTMIWLNKMKKKNKPKKLSLYKAKEFA